MLKFLKISLKIFQDFDLTDPLFHFIELLASFCEFLAYFTFQIFNLNFAKIYDCFPKTFFKKTLKIF